MTSGKSHNLGGGRTQTRHNLENLGVGGFLLVFLSRIEGLEAWERNALMFACMALGSAVLKWFSTAGPIRDGLLRKIGLLSLVGILFTGCAIQAGTVKPYFETGPNGNTIVACEVKGVTLAFGDGGVCRNVEGGHVSDAFSNLFSSTVGLAMRAVAGVFGGLGGIGTAMISQPVPPPLPPTVHPPAIVEEAPEPELSGSGGGFF